MKRALIASFLASLVIACEPDASEPPEPPGTLEYEHPYVRIYRADRRVDIVIPREDGERLECGILTERAYTELEDTLRALDPNKDYGYDPDVVECADPPGAWVHVEGFEHSPFSCTSLCCQPDLVRAALIYFLVETYFKYQGAGGVLEIDGEPYVAIEPDQPCP